MTTVNAERDITSYLKKRRAELIAWLKREDVGCFSRQKHLDEGTGERVYWHYGYLCAVRDMVRVLSTKGAKVAGN